MLYFSVFFLLLGSYMEFTEYWIHSHWIRADARVLSVKVYESVDRIGRRGNKSSYGSRCQVSYLVAGAPRQSEIDSGDAFTHSEDTTSYAARVTAGRRSQIVELMNRLRRAQFCAFAACLFVGAAIPLSAQEPAQQSRRALFDGKDLNGWQQVGPGSFVVRDGMMKTEGGMGMLWYTREKIAHATIRVVFKTHRERIRFRSLHSHPGKTRGALDADQPRL